MGKWIYLIGLLNNVGTVGFLGFLFGMVAVCVTTWRYYTRYNDIGYMIRFRNDETEINERRVENKSMRKNIKISIIISLTGLLVTTLIPSKQDMYAIALTKDVEVGQIYELSKEELKSGIDYFFEKLDSLNK